MPRPATPRMTTPRICGAGVTRPQEGSSMPSFKEALFQVEVSHMREIDRLRQQVESGALHQQQIWDDAFTPLTSPHIDAQLCPHIITSKLSAGAALGDVLSAGGAVHGGNAQEEIHASLVSSLNVSVEPAAQAIYCPMFREEPNVVPHGQPSIDLPWLSEAATANWESMVCALLCKCVLNPIWSLDHVPLYYEVFGSEKSQRSASIRPFRSFYSKTSKTSRSSTWETLILKKKKHNPTFACKAIHPFGKLRLSWDSLGLAICMFEIVMLPLLVAELLESNMHISATSCVFWTADLALALCTGYLTGHGLVEMRFSMAVRKYCKTWFATDFTLTTMDWLILGIGETWSYGKALKSVLRFVRLARLIRILRLANRVQDQLGRVTSQVMFTILRLASYIAVVVLLNHYIACAWCATWPDRAEYPAGGDFRPYKYLTALHWSLAHCFLGSMDVYPESGAERLFTCVVLVLALAVFSIILSMITNDALLLRSLSEAKNRRNMMLLSYFSDHKLPTSLTCRVWHFVQEHKLFDSEAQRNDANALQLLPVHIQQEIQQARFLRILRHHPFFNAYAQVAPIAMKQMCNHGIVVETRFPEEQLMLSNAGFVHQMVFVEQGQLLYFPDDQPIQIVIGPHMWAFEAALWASNASVSGQLIAGMVVCTVLVLRFSELQKVANHHQTSLPFLHRYAREFVDTFNAACTKYASGDVMPKDVLFNDPAEITAIVDEVLQTETTAERFGILSLMVDSPTRSQILAKSPVRSLQTTF